MALIEQAGFYDGSNTHFKIDTTSGDLVPVNGNAGANLSRGIGRQSGYRALVNQFLPSSVAMVQTVPGAEKASFTTRASVTGTLVNAFNLASSQTGGTFPAGDLNLLGRTIRCTGGGIIQSNATPDYTFDIALGSNILATTGAKTVTAIGAASNFWFKCTSTVTTAGSSGVINTVGVFNYFTATVVTITWPFCNSTAGTGLSIDLTAAYALTANATCSTSHASNKLTLTNLLVEILY